MSHKVIEIRGNGTSLWGESEGVFEITDFVFAPSDFDEKYGSLDVQGTNIKWYQYTDELIEKEVMKKIAPLLEKEHSIKVKRITWSEQGLQPDEGWNFDVVLKK